MNVIYHLFMDRNELIFYSVMILGLVAYAHLSKPIVYVTINVPGINLKQQK